MEISKKYSNSINIIVSCFFGLFFVFIAAFLLVFPFLMFFFKFDSLLSQLINLCSTALYLAIPIVIFKPKFNIESVIFYCYLMFMGSIIVSNILIFIN